MHTLIGYNEYRGKTTPVALLPQDRLRHTYMIGKTGVGKSTLFANMALQDIINYSGLCFMDPHGDTIDWLLNNMPESRLQDVVLFRPSDTEFPTGLNLLEAYSENEKDFLVSELILIFYKLFDPEKTGVIGPQFEHWLRNAALTVMAGEGGNLLEIPKLFSDPAFEKYKLTYVTDPQVKEFWTRQMARTADFHRSEMLNYFNSKFGHFLNNALCRNIIGQPKSGFNLDSIIAGEKILLVDLSKGKIGELNAFMLGLILISKLQSAILKRASLPQEKRPPFYLYVDEFQNLTTDTFASMLSESRKYGLGVHITNQYFSQLPVKIRDAVIGNTGNLLCFQVGSDDAMLLEKQFTPFSAQDLANLPRHAFYAKLTINSETSPAFSVNSLAPGQFSRNGFEPAKNAAENVLNISRLAYGVPRILAERQIAEQLKQFN